MLNSGSVIGVVGLGYVGLPLVVEFGKTLKTVGFDISVEKVDCCRAGADPSRELTNDHMALAKHADFTVDPSALSAADFIIVAVPTPVDQSNAPDFLPLVAASKAVARNMKRGAIIVYESTVYPGATEEICIPILEQESGLRWKEDFWVGYSPERINPGDHERTLTQILKIVSGDTPDTTDKIAALYEHIVVPGVYRASSIKVAEAAKVIENTQRDLNIALMNELAIIFARLNIDTSEVLEAAGTKWNFLKFKPGLVGGHCIGVDPYYLTHKAQIVGYQPEVILAGRRINDGMGKFVAEQTVKLLAASGKPITGSKIMVMGLTFKENCGDLRNSKVIDIIRELQSYGVDVIVVDPRADADEALREYAVNLQPWDRIDEVDSIIVAVPHNAFVEMPTSHLISKLGNRGVFVDVKAAFDAAEIRQAGHAVWRL
jgi:UDP-N-acetyl-D-galactosamine dehydrogenase